jgi:hypothetical protein
MGLTLFVSDIDTHNLLHKQELENEEALASFIVVRGAGDPWLHLPENLDAGRGDGARRVGMQSTMALGRNDGKRSATRDGIDSSARKE